MNLPLDQAGKQQAAQVCTGGKFNDVQCTASCHRELFPAMLAFLPAMTAYTRGIQHALVGGDGSWSLFL